MTQTMRLSRPAAHAAVDDGNAADQNGIWPTGRFDLQHSPHPQAGLRPAAGRSTASRRNETPLSLGLLRASPWLRDSVLTLSRALRHLRPSLT
jgi:hypothetical protein